MPCLHCRYLRRLQQDWLQHQNNGGVEVGYGGAMPQSAQDAEAAIQSQIAVSWKEVS